MDCFVDKDFVNFSSRSVAAVLHLSIPARSVYWIDSGVGEMVVTRHDSLVVALFLGVDLG